MEFFKEFDGVSVVIGDAVRKFDHIEITVFLDGECGKRSLTFVFRRPPGPLSEQDLATVDLNAQNFLKDAPHEKYERIYALMTER